MNIGIMTFHAGFNHGAFLQAYAMQKTLFNLNLNNAIINYQDFHQFLNEYKCALITRQLKDLPVKLHRIFKFKRSLHQCSLTLKMFNPREQYLNTNFNSILYGSDEIWNLNNCVFGYDQVFFGQNINLKKVSYAPSFGSTPSSTQLPEHIINKLNEFSNISVRDTNSQKIIENNLNITPQIVPDPTFLYDIFSDAIDCRLNDYILVYAINLSETFANDIQTLAQKQRKKIISVGYHTPWAHKNIINLSPFELMGFYQNADMVFTDLFHGTIFSVLSNKQFILELSGYRQNKFFPMLDILGLTDRIYRENMLELMAQTINYDIVNINRKRFRQFGIDYLNSVYFPALSGKP